MRPPPLQIHAEADNPIAAASGSFSTRVLLGRRDDEMLEAHTRTLIELISRRNSSPPPLLLAISVREHSAEMFRGIMRELEENRVW